MATRMKLEGSLVAIVTPFAGGEVDYDALGRLIEMHIEAGTQGLVPCGTTGESPTLNYDEHDRVIAFTVDKAAGRVPVVAGTGSNSTAEAVALTKHAKSNGADACLIVNPYYNKPPQRGMFEHIQRIAEAELPIVLYNGQARWSAATDVGELVEPMPGGLARYCPRQRYLLLDEGRVDEREPLAMRNLVAALFRLEKSREPSEVREMVGALGTWLHAPEQIGLRRAFTVWIKRVLLPGRLPGVRVPEVTDLQEVESMLAERVVEWTEQWKREGLEQGLEQGRREMLGKLIEGKFGALPEWARERLAQGSQGELEMWAERLFEAGSLEEVFG